MCAASTSPATPARATRSCAASSASSSRPGTTADKIKLSRDRVDRLGYFRDVNVDTAEVPGSPDQVDLTITVEEKPTGNLQLGAGFSRAEKLSLTASIKQENVFGSGNYLGIEINTSKYNRDARAQHGRPVLHDRRHLARDRPLLPHVQAARTARARTTSWSPPGSRSALRRSVQRVRHGLLRHRRRAHRDQAARPQLPNSYFLYREQFGDTSNSLPLTVGWARDDRDSALVPTSGRFSA